MLIPIRPGSEEDRHGDTTLFDPRRATDLERRRWELQAAQWRAVALARAVFGSVLAISMSDGLLDGPFGGILDLSVPFRDLTRHRDLESIFVSAAGRDPLLRRVPLIFAFSAVPADSVRVMPSNLELRDSSRRPARP